MRHLIKPQTLSLMVFVWALAGCEVGPDYQKPETALPNSWVSEEAKQTAAKAEIDQEWWKNFNDPVLTQFIDKASANNFDLKIAEARITQARASVSSAEADLLPKGDIKGTATREANQFAFPGGSNSPFTNLLHKPFNNFQTGFDASWELDVFGGSQRAEESAEAQLQSAEASRDDVLVSLLAEVARTYVDIRSLQSQLATAQDIIAADKKTIDIAEQRFDAGQTARLDVTQAEASLEQAQSALPQIRSQMAGAEFAMDVLLGEQPGATHTVVERARPLPSSNKDLVLAAPASVIAQRPDIRMAERKLAAATAQQGAAVAKFFPDISLNGFLGVLNTSVNNLTTPANQSWLASGSVIWPILSYGTLSSNLDAANAQQQEAMASYQKSIISALSDVERSLKTYKEQESFLQSLTKEAEKNAHARDIALERYKGGMTSFLTVLDAERTLYNSQNELIKAQADYTQDLIAVYKSLGGGWRKS